jgi:hypothetical protein
MIKNRIPFIAIIAFLLWGCKKENAAPVITITSPTQSQTFTKGATVNVMGTAADDKALHEAAVIVTNSWGDTVLSEYPTVHSQPSFDFNYSFQAVDSGMHHVTVVFADHDNAETYEEVMFTVN